MKCLQDKFENFTDEEIAEFVSKEFQKIETANNLEIDEEETKQFIWAVSWHNFYEGSFTELFNNKASAIECYRHRYKHVDSIHLSHVPINSVFNPNTDPTKLAEFETKL